MPGNRRADFALVARQLAAEDRVVNLLHLPGGELGGKREVRLVILGHHQAAAGFLVEPVDDARTRNAADAAQLPRAMVKQGIDQRVFFVASGGMHHQPRRFVQDQQGLVLKQDRRAASPPAGLRRRGLPASAPRLVLRRAAYAWV